MRVYAQIAEETNAAVLLVHHFKKGHRRRPGIVAWPSTQGGGARCVLTMTPMTTGEATSFSIPAADRRLHVRVDDAKNNMARPSENAEWIRLASHSLGNGTTDYPHGDNVQVAVPWSPPEPTAGFDKEKLNRCLQAVASGEGLPPGDRYSPHKNADNAYAGKKIAEILECGKRPRAPAPGGVDKVRFDGDRAGIGNPSSRQYRQCLFLAAAQDQWEK